MKIKKILPAFALLLVSAVMATTATYAWFAMNTEVTGDGMQIEGKSDSIVLQISNTEDTFPGSSYTASAKLMKNPDPMLVVNHGYTSSLVTLTATPASGTYVSATHGSTDFYEEIGNNYVKVTPHVASEVNGLYTEASLNITKVTSGTYVSGDYYAYADSTFTKQTLSADDPLTGLYTIDSTATAIAVATPYAGGTYLRKTGDNYAYVQGLQFASKLDGYVTLADSAVVTTADGTSEYFFEDNNDYVSIGVPANGTSLTDYLYWGYAYSGDPTEVQPDNSITVIPSDSDFTDYYLKNIFYVRMSDGSNSGENLKVNSASVEKVDGTAIASDLENAIRILFIAKGEDGDVINSAVYNNREKTTAYHTGSALEASIDGDAAEEITIETYIYFDGTDEAVKTTNVTADFFEEYKISFALGVD